MNHRDYYQQSFNRRGVLGAIEFFSRSAENEQDLMRQAGILGAGGDPRQTGAGPPPEPEAQSQASADSDRYEVGQCPDCGRPFATTVGRRTAPTARNVGGGRVRLDEQRRTAEKRPYMAIRTGTPGVVLRPTPRGPWLPQTGNDTRPLYEEAGGVGPGQDPRPETEAGASAPGRHHRPDRLDRHGPRHATTPGRHQATRPGGAHPGGHIRTTRRHRGRRPQRPGPGTGSLRPGCPGTHPPT